LADFVRSRPAQPLSAFLQQPNAVGCHIQVITDLVVLAGVSKANSAVDYGAEMSGAKRCCIKRSPRSRNTVFRTGGAKLKLSATVRLASCTQFTRALRLLT
jgi:hypothetical protein